MIAKKSIKLVWNFYRLPVSYQNLRQNLVREKFELEMVEDGGFEYGYEVWGDKDGNMIEIRFGDGWWGPYILNAAPTV